MKMLKPRILRTTDGIGVGYENRHVIFCWISNSKIMMVIITITIMHIMSGHKCSWVFHHFIAVTYGCL